MSAASQDSESSQSSSGYEDGLGRRVLAFDRETGEMRERLVLRPELTAFAAALTERIAIVAEMEDERFARPRSVERDAHDRLTVVSEYVAGRRLSDVLEAAAEHGIVAGLDAGLGLLLELLPAIARLHDAGLAHGALAAGRVMITPAGQLVLLDSIYAEPLERLKLTRRRLWSEFRLVFPASAGGARFDKSADLGHAAMIAVALSIGRPLRDDDYPDGLPALRQEILEIASIRGSKAFATGVDKVFAGALPLAGKRVAVSADEAAIDLRKLVRKELGITTCRTALLEFFQQVEAAEAERVAGEAQREGALAAQQAAGAAGLETERVEAERIARERAEAEEAARIERERAEQARVEAEQARIERERAETARAEAERIERERVEQARLEAERLEAERREKARLEAERLEKERQEKARLEAERLENERREQARLEAERLEREGQQKARLEAERLEKERQEKARLEAERLEHERKEQARLEAERLANERREKARLEAERVEKERQERARLEAERRERERLEKERAEQARLEAERIERERIAAEQARLEAERLERERLERARVEAERLERERLEKERAEQARLEAERIERERIAAEQARLEAERIEKERQARLEAERLERERLEKERAEQARLEAERIERERVAAEQARLEAERIEKERQARLEAERLERERLEKERAEQARLEAERIERERVAAEQARLEAERLERERAERARLEAERLERERAEKARLEAERLERERLETERRERVARERAEKARLEAERAEKARLEAERLAEEHAAAERRERELLEAARAERERAEKARLEAERLEQERVEQARLAAEREEEEEARERDERARIEAERVAAEERERALERKRERERDEAAARAFTLDQSEPRHEKPEEEAPAPVSAAGWLIPPDRASKFDQTFADAPPAAAPAEAGGWLIPPDRASKFDQPIAETPPPAASARSYPIYVPPSEPESWTPDMPLSASTPKQEAVADVSHGLAAPPPPPSTPVVPVSKAEPIRLKDGAGGGTISSRAPSERHEPEGISAAGAYEPKAKQRPPQEIPWKLIAAGVVLIAATAAIRLGYTPSDVPIMTVVRKVTPDPAAKATPPPAVTGGASRLTITTQPPGARVLIDGKPAGETPLSLDTIKPGRHVITLIAASGTSVKRTVRVEAGRTLAMDVPLFAGFARISAPFVLEISENGKALGSSDEQIILPPGSHTLRLANRELGYVATETVEIEPGEETRLSVDPRGRANINAVPWAEVFIDGEKAGETPLANVAVRLGVREFVFKNPQFGERKVVVTVTASATASVSVDFSK